MFVRFVRNKSLSIRAATSYFGMLIVGLALLAGCSQNPASNADSTPTAISAPVVISTPVPTPTVKNYLTPEPASPLMGQIWQPPEPQKHVEQVQPTAIADSPDALLVYDAVSLGGSSGLKITTSGEAILDGYQGDYTTYTLTADEFSKLKQQITDTDFFNLQDRYWQVDPPGTIVEMSIVDITYKDKGRSKTVSTRGTNESPQALITLESALDDLIAHVQNEGTASAHPELLVGYYLQGSKSYTWSFDIDVEGGVYYGDGPAEAHLSKDDLKAVNNALASISDLGHDQWYAAPDGIRDTIYMHEHRAIVEVYGLAFQDLNATSGGDVPKSLDATLSLLATLYDKYAP